MNRIAVARRKIKRLSRIGLATMVLAATGADAPAETRTNPYFQAAQTSAPAVSAGTGNGSASGQAPRLTRLGPIQTSAEGTGPAEKDPGRSSIGQPIADAQFLQEWLGEKAELPKPDPFEPEVSSKECPAPRRLAKTPSKTTPKSTTDVNRPAPQVHETGSAVSFRPQSARPAKSSDWSRSITRESCEYRARRHLDNAYREYSVGAWASAEASAWKSLELTATGIDVEDGIGPGGEARFSASEALRAARIAIDEAMDFVSSGASIDPDTMTGIVASHQSPVIESEFESSLSPTAAVDRYLDFASKQLAPIAARQVDAAQAMDLIAAIKLGRDDPQQLPEEMSLCLRRAALRGQPSNSGLASRLGMQLADMGLHAEARQTLQHAMSLEPTREVAQTLANVLIRCNEHDAAQQLFSQIDPQAISQAEASKATEVVQLSPAEFASLSPAFNQASPSLLPSVVGAPDSTTSTGPKVVSIVDGPNIQTVIPGSDQTPSQPSFLSGMLSGFRKPFSRASKAEGPSENFDPNDVIIPPIDSLQIESNVDRMLSERQDGAFKTVGSKQPKKSMVKRVLGAIPKPW